MVAVAILGAGAIGAGASIYGANKAADAQTSAANSGNAQQNAMYANNQNILSPFIQGGSSMINAQKALLDPNNPNSSLSQLKGVLNPNDPNSALGRLSGLLNPNGSGPLAALQKLTMPGADMSATLAQTPGYQFSLDQGLRASNNQLAARGLGGSGGAVAKGATNFAEGLAGNTWQSVVAALQNQYNSQLTGNQNQFTSQANAGQNLFNSEASAGQNLINTGTTAASALAGVGTNTANSITGSLTGAGNAQAAAANATGGAISNVAGQLPSNVLLSQLLKGQGGSGGGGIYSGNTGFNAQDAAMNQQLFPGYGTG